MLGRAPSHRGSSHLEQRGPGLPGPCKAAVGKVLKTTLRNTLCIPEMQPAFPAQAAQPHLTTLFSLHSQACLYPNQMLLLAEPDMQLMLGSALFGNEGPRYALHVITICCAVLPLADAGRAGHCWMQDRRQ